MEPRSSKKLSVRFIVLTIGLTLLVSVFALLSQRLIQNTPTNLLPEDRPEGIPAPLDLDAFLLNRSKTQTPPPGPAHPFILQIERIGVDVLVVTVNVDPEGYLVTPTRYAGYWGKSSPLDGSSNVVIVGHNRTYPRPVFLSLKNAVEGDEIKVIDQFGKEYRYVVSQVVVAQASVDSPKQPIDFVQPTDKKQMTLMTCYPDEACGSRWIVIAFPAP